MRPCDLSWKTKKQAKAGKAFWQTIGFLKRRCSCSLLRTLAPAATHTSSGSAVMVEAWLLLVCTFEFPALALPL